MRPGHWIALDCVVGAVAALCGAASIDTSLPSGQSRISLFLLFMATVFLCVGLRRRAPATAFGALVVLGVALSGLSLSVDGVIFLAAAFVLYTVTVEGRRRTGITALALVLAVMVVITVAVGVGRNHYDGAGVFVPVALASIIACLTGYSVRQRRRYAVGLQLEAASRAVSEERLRIARELHDVVAHSMSVIAVQAGYGQYVIDASPDDARDALGAIQATSREALEEMRRMLGVLRQRDAGPDDAPVSTGPPLVRLTEPDRVPPLLPAPGLSGLDRLIERTRGAGVRVSLEVAGPARPAPAGVDLSAYRIIQEALTNVVRHAGTGAACAVSLHYAEAELNLRVTDDGGGAGGSGTGAGGAGGPAPDIAAAGSGHGLIGMRERVHLCGGTFSVGPRADGGFAVTAVLPLPPAVPGPPDSGQETTGGSAAPQPAPAGPAAVADHAGGRP
jgi:signal transduction histidine kinase